VWEALDLLRIDRMDHGNRSMEDPALVRRIVAEGMTLTVCPLSNHRLCVVDDLKDHPVPEMLRQGIRVTLNSDDPAYFGGYLLTNFEAVFAALPQLSGQDAWQLARNSIDASFAPEGDKATWRAQLDAVFDALLV
jgi:adenosine deaminase